MKRALDVRHPRLHWLVSSQFLLDTRDQVHLHWSVQGRLHIISQHWLYKTTFPSIGNAYIDRFLTYNCFVDCNQETHVYGSWWMYQTWYRRGDLKMYYLLEKDVLFPVLTSGIKIDLRLSSRCWLINPQHITWLYTRIFHYNLARNCFSEDGYILINCCNSSFIIRDLLTFQSSRTKFQLIRNMELLWDIPQDIERKSRWYFKWESRPIQSIRDGQLPFLILDSHLKSHIWESLESFPYHVAGLFQSPSKAQAR